MTLGLTSKLSLSTLVLLVCCSWSGAQAAALTCPSDRNTICFGDHDIGTPAKQTLIVVNNTDAIVNLSASISGPNPGDVPGDFALASVCRGEVSPKASCQIEVAFNPAVIGKDKGEGEDRKATLTVLTEKGDLLEKASLWGKAFQNLGVTPTTLDFESQLGSVSGVSREVRITNYTNAAVSGVVVTLTGDFTENHTSCSTPLSPGGSCALSVGFAPKQAGDSSGALTIAANAPNLGRLPRIVSLHGIGRDRCTLPKFSFLSWSSWFVPIVSGLYFLGLVLVRWHMIAKPARAQLVAEIEAVRSRAVAETASRPDSPDVNGRLARIHYLLDLAVYPFKYKQFPINPEAQGRRALPPPVVPPWHTRLTRFFNALFWTRGQELAGWSLAHEAELQLIALLPPEIVRARLETAEQELRDIKTPLALYLADQVRDALVSGQELVVERATQLLQQFQLLLKRMSAPDAARQAWLADLQQRLLSSLQQFRDWAQKTTADAAMLDECRSRIQSVLNTAATYQNLIADLGKIPDPGRLPTQLQGQVKQISDFLSRLVDSIKKLPGANDAALTLDGCNKSVSMIAEFDNEAATLLKNLRESSPPDEGKVYQALLDLCKTQASLIDHITQATAPGPATAMLQDLLAALRGQTQTIQKISQAALDGTAADFGNCRDLVLQLAIAPALPEDLSTRIDNVLVSGELTPLARWRALLAEVLSVIYDSTDNDFSQLASWHNKMMWLVGCALLFMFALAVTLGNAVLLLLGAVGGLLSRLTRTTAAADVPNDYGATWGSLFLSPLTGALSAWGGILLIILGLKFNILGSALNLDWCNPYEPVALAVGLLFGFSERLFDSVTNQLQDRLLKPPASSPPATTSPPTPAAPAPKITSVSPSSAVVGKEVQLTIRGINFQRGAAATVTKDTGEPLPAKLDFTDASSVVVTCIPTGAKGFSATITITNPDKQVATGKLDVTA